MKSFVFFVAIAALMLPTTAQSATGMAMEQYYVGSWSCVGGDAGKAPSKATLTYTLDSGLLREWIVVPPQGKMTSPYALSIVTSYDAKNNRYVQTGVDNGAGWWVSYAKPWSGNTEQWTDHAGSNPLGRSQTTRVGKNTFTDTGYASMTATSPHFKAICHRAS